MLLAPGTQWSQKPTDNLPAAKVPRTKGAAKAVAAVWRSVRRVSRELPIGTSLCCRRRIIARHSSAGCVGYLRPHEAFEFGCRPVDRLVDRLAGLCAMRDHLGHRRLREDLVADQRRRWSTRDRGDHIAARRIIIESALGRPFLLPGLEVAQLFKGRNVIAVTGGDQLLDRGALRQKGEKALCRRFVRRKAPDRPEIWIPR